MCLSLIRFQNPLYWSAFTLIGKDVAINLGDIRHAMLDQTLDKSEEEIEEETGREYLNPKPTVPPGNDSDVLPDHDICAKTSQCPLFNSLNFLESMQILVSMAAERKNIENLLLTESMQILVSMATKRTKIQNLLLTDGAGILQSKTYCTAR